MAAENCVLLKGLFTSGGKEHQLHLSDAGLHWHVPSSKTPTDTDIPWIDIFGVSSDQGEATPATDRKSFTIHYITRKKDKKWRAAEKKFEVKDGNVADWLTQIHAKYRPGTPKNLLVIVNPIGGKGDGRQLYEKKVAPLFKAAGINVQLFYTERARHAEEIVNTFDFSKVEGLVTVGGDGMYQEVINTLLQRVQKQTGIDIDDPETPVTPLESIKIGIVPAGTGNGVSGWACGTVDVETSVLHIIRGEIRRFNAFSVHTGGKLLTYCGLLFGYGYSADMIRATESKRWMRRARYPYVMLTKCLGKLNLFTAEFEYLEGGVTSPENSREESEGATAAVSDAKGWKKLESHEYVDLMSFVANLKLEGEKAVLEPTSKSTFVCLSRSCGGFTHVKTLIALMQGKKSGLEASHIKLVENVVGFRVKVKVTDEEAAKKDSFLQYLDIDGEVYKVDDLNIDVRFHAGIIPMFSSEGQSSPEQRRMKKENAIQDIRL